jgi:hypothetical protein
MKAPLPTKCQTCDKEYVLMVDPKDLQRWRDGAYIQDALSYLKAGERELLLSGTCDACWYELYGEEDEEEQEEGDK